jgi:hypothetical protein
VGNPSRGGAGRHTVFSLPFIEEARAKHIAAPTRQCRTMVIASLPTFIGILL